MNGLDLRLARYRLNNATHRLPPSTIANRWTGGHPKLMDTPDHMYSPQFFKAVWKSEVYRDQKANNSRKIARTKKDLNLSFLMIQF
ncbi:MAG: hypothetical protein GTO24_10410 [candidate division Zixibacteria bacterium]|nr:hypothetical protein [candidate division Zixibacteria bacterium]